MDNLTHTIVGLAVGEVIHRSLSAEPTAAAHTTRHRLLLTACAAASNFPDLDLVLVKLLPNPLGYLLHHRGHTHTLLLEIPQALLLCALLWLLWPAARRLLRDSRAACAGLALSVIAGFLLHIAMDGLNSYGIHPFYPFDMRWRYGDLVFIVEPVFWVGAGAPLLMGLQRRWLRLACATALALVLAACALVGLLHWASLLLLAAIGAAVAIASADGRGRAGLVTGLGLGLAFIGVQALGSGAARTMLLEDMVLRAPGARLVDAALTAYPANPLCWNYAAIERDSGDDYHVRRGVLSLAPGLLPVASCPAGLSGPVALAPASAIALQSDDSASLSALRRRATSDCWMNAWLRFARTPLLSGDSVSDLRFSNGVAANFTTIDLDRYKGRGCPAPLPPWAQPRADLLAP